MDDPITSCPIDHTRDDRKSAGLAARYLEVESGARIVAGFAEGRSILRSPHMLQAGIGAEQIAVSNPAQASVFFLDGELHKRRRAAIARYFTPRAITTRYREIMERTTANLIAALRREGRARVDIASFQLAVDVAAEIIGLTNSNSTAMAERIRKTLDSGGGAYRLGPMGRALGMTAAVFHAVSFLLLDVLPAIMARRKARREDVISHMLNEGYSIKAMLIECLTYGAAGMVTTREFIVMAAWHLLEREDLSARFLDMDEPAQIALLEEILRLEPVASVLHRRSRSDAVDADDGLIAPGQLYAVDVRAANTDESAAGSCPYAIDPDRAKRMKQGGAYLSFGDGSHRCPGSQVALHEARIFLDRLLRVPGITLAEPPRMRWRPDLMSYELRNAIITCERD